MEQSSVYISNGKRPWWHTFIASLFFTFSLCIAYVLFFDTSFIPKNKEYGHLFYVLAFSFMMGVRYSEVIDYEFDFTKMEYNKIRVFGFIKIPSSRPFSNLKYVSVFYKESADIYEINLWHGKNKRFLITTFLEAQEALQVGKDIASKLSLDTWDAKNPRDGKWLQS